MRDYKIIENMPPDGKTDYCISIFAEIDVRIQIGIQ